MSWKITLCDGDTPKPLPDDIVLVGGLHFGHELIVTSAGIAKYRPSDTPKPVTITLQQALGHDKKLWELFGKKAGFKLKFTLSLPTDDGNGGVIQKDVLDINALDLVPDDFHISEVLTFTASTLTPLEFIWPEPPPQRQRRVG
jgi:hypothetical protein